MDWQEIVAIAVVLTTLLIFIIRMKRSGGKGGCGSDCGCDQKKD